MFRGLLPLQKVHATAILKGKRETKRNNPKMHVSSVHVTIYLQSGLGVNFFTWSGRFLENCHEFLSECL